ncbi:hypothetical protein L5515_012480 [Caenorhabditis briggsae]|uniref:Uncharacterized protein n=1 Tax=Caenorhabditis briggsae TaxID=6238 RepID=A0AAE9ESP0_CAEBR|nr:hypothetical protein L5515_012480 [Caenorhabditis briggsae]
MVTYPFASFSFHQNLPNRIQKYLFLAFFAQFFRNFWKNYELENRKVTVSNFFFFNFSKVLISFSLCDKMYYARIPKFRIPEFQNF